ncbi:hypothetical protein DSO57_1039725 [Entomophthora muscae]|uniref:Uncharacterized protein n=1 Tax=Entomophthora muscae TaxID=34485 RepID=A0ACC2RLG4_9FUNG|nr:hypothetical protein DSO57_1039725 [Entomophthora muscae]
MHPVVGLLSYIPYNLILNRIITGRWAPAVGTLLLTPPNVNSMPTNLGVVSPVFKAENLVVSQCPEFYSEDTLMLSQAIYLELLWLGLIILLNPSISFGNFKKRYLKLHWWLIINSMWIWVVIPHHLETASYYPAISVTPGRISFCSCYCIWITSCLPNLASGDWIIGSQVTNPFTWNLAGGSSLLFRQQVLLSPAMVCPCISLFMC